MSVDWRTRLAALGGEDTYQRLRLSKADAKYLHRLKEAAYGAETVAAIAHTDGGDMARAVVVLRACLSETPPDAAVLDRIAQAEAAVFPVQAADLMPEYTGPALGRRLAALRALWIASGFAATRDSLLDTPES